MIHFNKIEKPKYRGWVYQSISKKDENARLLRKRQARFWNQRLREVYDRMRSEDDYANYLTVFAIAIPMLFSENGILNLLAAIIFLCTLMTLENKARCASR